MSSENIDTEISFYIRNVGKNLGGNEQNKIMSIITKIISSKDYMEKVKKEFEPITNNENFNLNVDLPELIKILISVNEKCDFYKVCEPDRMQYVLYGIIYTSLIKNNIDLINKIDLTDFRLIFSNSMELLMMPSQKIRLQKQDCMNCLSRTFTILSFLESKLNIKN